jgi:transposase
MAYSEDYRKRAIEYMDKGHTGKELYEVFGIYPSAIERWRKLLSATGSLKTQYKETRRGKIDLEKLTEALKEQPEAYLKSHAIKFDCTKQAVHYALKRLKVTNKKNIHIQGKE